VDYSTVRVTCVRRAEKTLWINCDKIFGQGWFRDQKVIRF